MSGWVASSRGAPPPCPEPPTTRPRYAMAILYRVVNSLSSPFTRAGSARRWGRSPWPPPPPTAVLGRGRQATRRCEPVPSTADRREPHHPRDPDRRGPALIQTAQQISHRQAAAGVEPPSRDRDRPLRALHSRSTPSSPPRSPSRQPAPVELDRHLLRGRSRAQQEPEMRRTLALTPTAARVPRTATSPDRRRALGYDKPSQGCRLPAIEDCCSARGKSSSPTERSS
jgi:hypothetical protein